MYHTKLPMRLPPLQIILAIGRFGSVIFLWDAIEVPLSFYHFLIDRHTEVMSLTASRLPELTQLGVKNDDGDDGRSEGSSTQYSEEPFDLFQTRILCHFSRFARTLFPIDIKTILPANVVSSLSVTRQKGGGFNRITELSLSVSGGDSSSISTSRYIWRTPRYLNNDVARTALMLQYLTSHTSLPIPTVLSFSGTDENISDRYILTDLLPGRNLTSVLNDLNLSLRQRLQLAERMAGVMADIHGVVIPGEEGLIGNLCVHPASNVLRVKTFDHHHSFDYDSSSNPNASSAPPAPVQTLRSFVLARLQRHLDRLGGKSEWYRSVYLRLIEVAKTLLDPERLPVDVVCRSVFVHCDLMPRNILVGFESEGQGQGEEEAEGDRDLEGLSVIDGAGRWEGGIGGKLQGGGEDVGDGEGKDDRKGQDEREGQKATRTDEDWCPGKIIEDRDDFTRQSDQLQNIGDGIRSKKERTHHPVSSRSKNHHHRESTRAIPRQSTPLPYLPSQACPSPHRSITVTGILDWDQCEAWPPLAAYTSPNWLWNGSRHRGPSLSRQCLSPSSSDSSTSSWWDADPDEGIDGMHPDDALVRDRFIQSIETHIPGYIETIRQGRRAGIKLLKGFAISAIGGKYEARPIDKLERLARQSKQERQAREIASQ